jgi:hypothetical protein
MSKITLPLLVLSLLLAACGGQPAATVAPQPTATGPNAGAEAEISALVEGFGARLQQVSLLAPDASDQILAQYAEFVAPDLLQAWAADPETAPGRVTSSPWPDHIEISTLIPQGDGYLVDAVVVEMTSSAESGRYAVILTVEQVDGQWLITGYTQGDYQ